MVNIILSPEQDNLEHLKIVVRNKTYNDLIKLQYSGGFKRFGLDLVDDNCKRSEDTKNYELLSKWLSKAFPKKLK